MSDAVASGESSSPSSSPSSSTSEPAQSTGTQAPAQGAQSASGDYFELEDGQKWTVDDLRKNWSKVKTNYLKGTSATQLLTKADQRLKQAQEYEQRYGRDSLKQRLAKDPQSFFKELELDPTDFATNLLMPEIERQQMTAEQRAFAEKERAVAQREERIREWEEQQKQAALEQSEKQHQESYRKAFHEALSKTGFGENPHVMRRMAAYMETFVDAEEPPRPEEVAQMVRDDIQGELKTLTDSLDGKGVIDLLGEALVKKIRAYDLQRLKSRQPGAQSQSTPPNPAVLNGAPQQKTKYITEAQRDAELQRRIQILNGGGE